MGAALATALALGAAGCGAATRSEPMHASGDVMSRSAIATQSGELPVMRPAERRAALGTGRGGGPLDSDTFGGVVHVHLRELERRVRDDVERGALGPQALEQLASGRRDVLATLRRVVRDGTVDGQEQQQLGALLRDLENECYQSAPRSEIGPIGPLRYWSPQE